MEIALPDYLTINDAQVDNEIVYHKNKNLLSLSKSNFEVILSFLFFTFPLFYGLYIAVKCC
jgi:hypothetical protein